MSFRAMVLRRSYLARIFFLRLIAPLHAAFGQAARFARRVRESGGDHDFICRRRRRVAAALGGCECGASADNQWLKVEFHYGTTAAIEDDLSWTPVEFKVWIEGLDLLAKHAPVPGKGVVRGPDGVGHLRQCSRGQGCLRCLLRPSLHPRPLQRRARVSRISTASINIHIEAYVGGSS